VRLLVAKFIFKILMLEHPSWRVYTRHIFQFLREESVTTNTFLCFIKNYLATRFRLIKL
jgi:hypothetical protein